MRISECNPTAVAVAAAATAAADDRTDDGYGCGCGCGRGCGSGCGCGCGRSDGRRLRLRLAVAARLRRHGCVCGCSGCGCGRSDGRRLSLRLRPRLRRLRLGPAAVGRTAEPNEICTEENWRWRANHRRKPRRKRAKFAPKKTGGGDRITESFQGAKFDAFQHEPPKRPVIPP